MEKKKHDNLQNTHIFYKRTSKTHLIEPCHQVFHSVTSLSTLRRHVGHRQRGLKIWMAFVLTLRTAQVSSEETEVVQGKDLQTDTVWRRQTSELLKLQA